MSVKSQHVMPNLNGGWSVRHSGSARASRVFKDQAAAVRYARTRAQKEQTELFVHRRDGTIAEANSYGSAPDRVRATR